MIANKNRMFPIIITIIIIVIIIYLFANIKQPYVECSKSFVDNLKIKVEEKLNVKLDSNKIEKIELTKTIILPDGYLDDDKYLNSIEFSLKKSYEYLKEDKVNISKLDDRLVAKVEIDKNETVILNNIEFSNVNNLQIRINSNTKSGDVIAFKIGDHYTEGELMKKMKNNGYVCK